MLQFTTSGRIGLFRCIAARGALIFAPLALVFLMSSCTLLAHSPHLAQRTKVPLLAEKQGLITDRSGNLPYQRWRIRPWDDEMRYIWIVGDYDFRKHDNVELVLYFHGMHSKDYYKDFRRELDALVKKRPRNPFVFVGFVDTPYVDSSAQHKDRWNSMLCEANGRPEKLFALVNHIYRAMKVRYPNIRKDKTHITLTAFSGGGKVLDSVTNWLAKADPDDPYARMFRTKLAKIVYFDCWFDKRVLTTIPSLLENNPKMKIVGTVHMKKPAEHAALLAERFKIRKESKKGPLMALDGRLTIFHDDSHWNAMISRLKEAL